MFQNPFIKTADDLVTTHEARRAGFLEAVLRRNAEETPYLAKAKALYTMLKSKTKTSSDVLKLLDIRDAFLDAAGVMQKTRNCLTDIEKQKLFQEFIKKVIAPTGGKYIDEIVYRYLMSLGEQLGGHMRNVIGKAAQSKLTHAIIAQLQLQNLEFKVHKRNGKWVPGAQYTYKLAEEVRAIQWNNGEYKRMLVYNLTVPGIGGRNKNVDIVIFNKQTDDISASTMKGLMADAKVLHLMGELKGGIDPAGGDEHWKTTRGALERIREAYKKAYVIFIGASIEKSMSKEIYTQLQNGQLDYVANLTNADQLAAMCGWIVEQ